MNYNNIILKLHWILSALLMFMNYNNIILKLHWILSALLHAATALSNCWKLLPMMLKCKLKSPFACDLWRIWIHYLQNLKLCRTKTWTVVLLLVTDSGTSSRVEAWTGHAWRWVGRSWRHGCSRPSTERTAAQHRLSASTAHDCPAAACDHSTWLWACRTSKVLLHLLLVVESISPMSVCLFRLAYTHTDSSGAAPVCPTEACYTYSNLQNRQ